MPETTDPYVVLGVAPEAGRQEVRRAFHRAVLRCHPDCCEGDAEEAKRRFSGIVAAYRLLRKRLAERAPVGAEEEPLSDHFDPADFACLSLGWEALAAKGALSPAKLEWLPRVARQKVVEPAVNETTAFVLCWIAAIVLALGAGAIAAAALRGPDGLDDHALAVAVVAMMGTYILVFVLSLVAIVAGRRTSWLLRVIGFRRQHALPSAPKVRALADENEIRDATLFPRRK